MSTPIRRYGRVIGTIHGNTYYTTRDSETVFCKYNSLNISEDVLLELVSLHVEQIQITFKHEGKEEQFATSVTQFWRGKRYSNGRDAQRCISLSELRDPKPLKQESPKKKEKDLAEFFPKKPEVKA